MDYHPPPTQTSKPLHPGYGLAWVCVVACAFAYSIHAAIAVLGLSSLGLLFLLYRAQQIRIALETERAALLRSEVILRSQANHDPLTGLANRLLLADRFAFTVERSRRSKASFGLLMVDLDDFKHINDTYGHAAGDLVLQVQASRLLSGVRSSDTVARLGGDEFVLLIESFENPREMVHIGRKLITGLSEPITLQNGVSVLVGASVGIALYPKHGQELSDLLTVADRGMYDCKTSGMMELQ